MNIFSKANRDVAAIAAKVMQENPADLPDHRKPVEPIKSSLVDQVVNTRLNSNFSKKKLDEVVAKSDWPKPKHKLADHLKTTTASGSDGNIVPGKEFGVKEGNLEALVGGSTDRARATEKLKSKKKTLIIRGNTSATTESVKEEPPFEGGRKVTTRKDQYGNVVKNIAKHLARKAMKDQETKTSKNEEVEQVDEGGMPSSVIKSKQAREKMSPEDLHAHVKSLKAKGGPIFGGKSVEHIAREMAWSHGHGKMSPHYWDRIKHLEPKNEEVEQVDEGKPYKPSVLDRLSVAAHQAAIKMGIKKARRSPGASRLIGSTNLHAQKEETEHSDEAQDKKMVTKMIKQHDSKMDAHKAAIKKMVRKVCIKSEGNE